MLAFIVRRLLLVIPSLAGLLVLTFFLIRVVPADPAAALAGENATPAQIAEIRRQYGLDQPLYVQFGVYLTQVARLDFGESAYSRRPVVVDIKQRLPATLELTLAALVFATLAGIPLGTLAAIYHNRWPDTLLPDSFGRRGGDCRLLVCHRTAAAVCHGLGLVAPARPPQPRPRRATGRLRAFC